MADNGLHLPYPGGHLASPRRNPTPSKTSGVARPDRPIPQTRPTRFIYTPYPPKRSK